VLQSFGEVYLYDPVAVNSSVFCHLFKIKQTQLSFPPGSHSSIISCFSNSIVHTNISTQHING